MNNRGITLMTLVITIIIMIILAGVTITGTYSLIKKSKLENLKTDMLLIQAKTKTALEEYNFSKDETKLIGTKLEEADTEKVSKLNKAGITDISNWYFLSQDDLNNMNLSDIRAKDGEYYFVKYDKENLVVDILYTEGFVENGITKFTLTQLQNME
mgnify:FL=1